jgi:hypothetical protein
MYRGVPYYYPVPVPYYAYYDHPPVGAIIVMVAGVTYLMSQDGSYSKKSTSSEGKEVYQAVPPPQGASIKTLPASRVLVTVSGTTYYLSANAFYRRVMSGAQETWVTVTPPASAGAAPPATAATPQAAGQAPTAKPASTAAAVQAVAERFTVPQGSLLVVRFSTEVSSATAHVGDRVQGFLDHDLAADGRMVAPKGAKVCGVVSDVDAAGKMKGQAKLSVTLTDMQVGSKILSVKTQPVNVEGGKGTGAKKLVGGAAIGAAIGAIAGGGDGAAIGAAVGAGAGGVAAAAGSVTPAVIPAQTPEAFTLAVPLTVEIMTNVAVRAD